MLKKISIQNYAIIDELEIDFSTRLNVITGDTGAGKSIIAGAMGLILGERADTNVLLNREKKCIVEGIFVENQKESIRDFLKQNDLDPEEELVIRREIGANGKSRAFINDTPVNLNQIHELGLLLVDLHQQFDTLELNESGFQREVLDALGSQASTLLEYRKTFRQWQSAKMELENLVEQKKQFDNEADYNQFQFNELEEAGFHENELEELDAELKMLSNAEGIKEVLSKVYFALQESETPIVQELKILSNQLNAYSTYHPDIPPLLHRLQSVQVELLDIADETSHIGNKVNYDPVKISNINERLSTGYRMLKKHGVKTTNELLQVRDKLEEKLQAVFNIEEALQQKEKQTKQFYEQVVKMASSISDGRRKVITPFENTINRLLVQVGMPNARFCVEMVGLGVPQVHGIDGIEFLLDANKSNQFLPVRKVASGGELSRLMLCIKSLVAQSIDLPTMIFDEIDTGISGEAARQVSIIMKELSNKRQVICITHQPQIAGKADAHFFVYKEIRNSAHKGEPAREGVKTGIRLLTREERITNIAKMLSGEKPTAAALENAREMVMS
jgi:DNA repair protein RecN (Recombination protein N)